ncbi:unnamed protein product [Moneuplotes crassus]|uniref:Uncharacterized protein n=1 Tax=Euplotes crassus TaxID=5936 RepID=A0AAD2D6K7_EUPCR|nr:unnamed protein product [Moneuplotes crassus]
MYAKIERICPPSSSCTMPLAFPNNGTNDIAEMKDNGDGTYSIDILAQNLGNAQIQVMEYLHQDVQANFYKNFNINEGIDYSCLFENIDLSYTGLIHCLTTTSLSSDIYDCAATFRGTLTPFHAGPTSMMLIQDDKADLYINGQHISQNSGQPDSDRYPSPYTSDGFKNWIRSSRDNKIYFVFENQPFHQYVIDITWADVRGNARLALYWNIGEGYVPIPKLNYGSFNNRDAPISTKVSCPPKYEQMPTTINQCRLTCGNGFRNGTEPCDDGNIIGNDGCDKDCQIEPDWQCEYTKEGPSVCEYHCPYCPEEGEFKIKQFQKKSNDTCQTFCNTSDLVEVEYEIKCWGQDHHNKSTSFAAVGINLGNLTINNTNMSPDLKNYICSFTGRPNFTGVHSGYSHTTTFKIPERDGKVSENKALDILSTIFPIILICAIAFSLITSLLCKCSPSGAFILINYHQLLMLLLLVDTYIHPDVRFLIGEARFIMLDFQFLGKCFNAMFLISGFIIGTNLENPNQAAKRLKYNSVSTVYTNRNLLLLFCLIIGANLMLLIFYAIISAIPKDCSPQISDYNGVNDTHENNRAQSQVNQTSCKRKCLKCCKKITNFISKAFKMNEGFPWKLFISIYIRIILMTFLGLTLTSFNEIWRNTCSDSCSIASRVIAYTIFVGLIAFFVFSCIYFCYHNKNDFEELNPGEDQNRRNEDQIRDEEEQKYHQEELNEEIENEEMRDNIYSDSRRLFGELFRGLRRDNIARIYHPLMMARKIVFAISLIMLYSSGEIVLWIMLLLQIFYWAAIAKIENFPYKSIEFFMQFISETILLFLIIFLINTTAHVDWTPSATTTIIYCTTLHTCLLSILVICKSVTQLALKIKQCLSSRKLKYAKEISESDRVDTMVIMMNQEGSNQSSSREILNSKNNRLKDISRCIKQNNNSKMDVGKTNETGNIDHENHFTDGLGQIEERKSKINNSYNESSSSISEENGDDTELKSPMVRMENSPKEKEASHSSPKFQNPNPITQLTRPPPHRRPRLKRTKSNPKSKAQLEALKKTYLSSRNRRTGTSLQRKRLKKERS